MLSATPDTRRGVPPRIFAVRSTRQIPDLRRNAPTLNRVTSQNPDPGWQRPEDPAGRPASARLVDPEDDLGSGTYGGDFETTIQRSQWGSTYGLPGIPDNVRLIVQVEAIKQ